MISSKNHETLALKLQQHIGVRKLIAYYMFSLVGLGILIIPGIAPQIKMTLSFKRLF